ncbi:MAG: ATP-dependent RecD-like DNA helicase [Acutalibacteraceae bacterium]
MNKKLILDGTVEDVIFSSAESGYTVINVSCMKRMITAVGIMPGCSPGETVKLYGEFVNHPNYGRQFSVDKCERTMPESVMDMFRYLESGAVRGIGPALAEKITERFGEKTFEIIEYEPERLAEIKGITLKKANEISDSFKNQFAVREVIISLERWGLKPTEALSAYKAFGSSAIEKVNENPYCLCGEKVRLKFDRVDEIAKSFPNEVKDIYRQRAVIIHILKHNLNNGHTCIPREKLMLPAEAFDIERETAQAVIDDLIEDKELKEEFFSDKSYIFLMSEYRDEKSIADRIKVMLRFPPAKGKTFDREIDAIEEKNGIKFEQKQRLAITTAVSEGLLVLTGGPGTGKTTALNGILALFEKQKLRVQLAAPTGRAAMRMSEVTGRKAQTIHRLLEVEWVDGERQHFARNMQNPLEADAVIVDELSMVDTHIFACLLDALPLGCRLVLVGDSDQLPPVGAGNVLQDIIRSKLIPTVALTEIFRQSMESLIVTNAHKIVKGIHPDLSVKDKDFFFLSRTSVTQCAKTVTELCTKRLPEAYGYNPLEDIQILCPAKMGETGTIRLNEMMQKLLNPPAKNKEELISGSRIFREGDKVMQIKNNYDIVWKRDNTVSAGVFNGDIGIIKAVNHNARFMKIQFDDRTAIYPFDSVKELELAYAVTVHKSQGSEFECAVMPVCGVVSNLCYRNLLYTAVTRAKSKLILLGNQDEVYAMVDNDKKTKRYSALKYLLTEKGNNDEIQF